MKPGDKYDTDYFLVGGFDLDRCKGMIKLYKVNYAQKYDQTRIKFIQDIIIDKKDIKARNLNLNNYDEFKGFKGPINCITQSSKDGAILVSCWDGRIYLFKINIEDYLKYDKNDKLFEELFN